MFHLTSYEKKCAAEISAERWLVVIGDMLGAFFEFWNFRGYANEDGTRASSQINTLQQRISHLTDIFSIPRIAITATHCSLKRSKYCINYTLSECVTYPKLFTLYSKMKSLAILILGCYCFVQGKIIQYDFFLRLSQAGRQIIFAPSLIGLI